MKFLILLLFSFSVFAESDLGTPNQYFESFNKEYRKAVTQAMPTFKVKLLQRKFQMLLEKYPQGLPGAKIRTLKALQESFSLPPMELRRGQTFYEDPKGKFAAEVNMKLGQVQFYKNMEAIAPITPALAKAQMPMVVKAHDMVLRKLGIPSEQLMFKSTNFLYMQGESNPQVGPVKKTEVKVDQTLTYGLRQLDGLMVEESHVKFISKDPKNLEGIDVAWPDFKFHPEIRRIALKSKAELEEAVYKQIMEQEPKGTAINVRIAVVLRPVLLRAQKYFVPSVKVGVYSKRGEAGNLFYVDLLNQKLNFENEDQQDKE